VPPLREAVPILGMANTIRLRFLRCAALSLGIASAVGALGVSASSCGTVGYRPEPLQRTSAATTVTPKARRRRPSGHGGSGRRPMLAGD
jgi:hypothetical protein